jgi:signal transduction histidine kinase/CheY-like chemotaxis protein
VRKLLDADLSHPERCLRDIVALSTLPALWLGADTVRMAESLAAALYSTLGAQFVYVRLEETPAPVCIAQVDRYRTDPALAAAVGPDIIAWAREHDPEDMLALAAGRAGAALHVAAQPVGFDASLGVVAAGFKQGDAPSALQLTMLNVAATQAYTAVQNARLLRSLRENIAERERADAALREADRRKDEFLAMLSHELRNPLAAIATAIQLMRLRGAAVPELGTLERQTEHLRRLVDDLLDVSRITRGKIELRRQPVEIADALLRAMEMAQQQLESRSHRVTIDAVPRTGLCVQADPDRLAQILFNLLSNAAKYTPRGGHIELRAWRAGERIFLSVKDDGMGIAPDLIERVFDMFVQQEQTIARSEGGLGLGLTIVRSLVEQHGGRVRAHSAGVGKGSEFTLELPAATREPAAKAAAPMPAPERTGRRVLVVDDNVDAAQAIAELMGMLGHTVRVAHDGPQALAEAAQFEPEIALLDLGLPGMDGYELARALRQHANGAGAPRLVALSGYGLESDRARSAAAGFADHLVKPVELARLERVLSASAP